MKVRLNNWLIALGAVMIFAAILSAGKDVGRALPVLLSSAKESKGAAVIREVKLARSLIEKAQAAPDSAAGPSLPLFANTGAGEVEAPAWNVPEAADPASAANVTAAEADGLPEGEIPVRLVIPAIGLDAPVVLADTVIVHKGGQDFQQWKSPNKPAAGWHESSALLGQPGNTVMNGHHNIYGKVFARLIDLEPGDLITVYGEQQAYVYEVANKMILREKYQDLDVRMDNARWILPSEDERLTLVTCWPPETNTHRLIIVARPLGTGS